MKLTWRLIFALVLVLPGCSQSAPPAESPTAPTPAAAPTPSNEAAAIAALQDVNRAQADYFQRNRRYALDYEELITTKFLREEPAAAKTGYEFNMRPSADAARYTISATPQTPSVSARHLFTDQTGAVHADAEKGATPDSPKI